MTDLQIGEPGSPTIVVLISLGDLYNGNTLEANEHFPTVGGEHYTQFSNVIKWNWLLERSF